MHIIVVLGPAGSGKSTLTKTFGEWIEKVQRLKVAYVNLDPGAEVIPYVPNFDIRSIITVRDVMIKESLGPNGAFVKSIDIMAENKEYIIDRLKKFEDYDYVIVDTPGQMEPFVFRKAGPILVSTFKKLGRVSGIIVFDPLLAETTTDLVVLKTLGVITQIRLGIDSVIVLNKYDLIKKDKVFILKALNNTLSLRDEILKEGGMYSDIAAQLLELIDAYSQAARLVLVSAKTGEGMEDLYTIIHEMFCTCGDLT